MATWIPDPTFYPSPRLAAGAPPEKLAYVASFSPARLRNDELAVVDLDPGSPAYGQIVGRVAMPEQATSCTISAGMHAARACARTCRIPTSSDGI